MTDDSGCVVVEAREIWLGGWSNDRTAPEISRLEGRRCNFSVDKGTEDCEPHEEVGRGGDTVRDAFDVRKAFDEMFDALEDVDCSKVRFRFCLTDAGRNAALSRVLERRARCE